MITALFFIAGAIIATAGAVGTTISYLKSKHEALKYLALVFTFMALHAFAFSLPTLLFKNNLKLIAYGYTIGIGSVFILLFMGLRVQIFLTQKFLKNYANLIGIVIGVLGIIVVTLQTYDLRLPIISPSGIIFWNVNLLASLLSAVVFFFYGLGWTYILYGASNLTKGYFEKLKLLILSADGLLFGSGAVFIYTSRDETQSVVGLILFLTACVITLPIIFLPKRRLK